MRLDNEAADVEAARKEKASAEKLRDSHYVSNYRPVSVVSSVPETSAARHVARASAPADVQPKHSVPSVAAYQAKRSSVGASREATRLGAAARRRASRRARAPRGRVPSSARETR